MLFRAQVLETNAFGVGKRVQQGGDEDDAGGRLALPRSNQVREEPEAKGKVAQVVGGKLD